MHIITADHTTQFSMTIGLSLPKLMVGRRILKKAADVSDCGIQHQHSLPYNQRASSFLVGTTSRKKPLLSGPASARGILSLETNETSLGPLQQPQSSVFFLFQGHCPSYDAIHSSQPVWDKPMGANFGRSAEVDFTSGTERKAIGSHRTADAFQAPLLHKSNTTSPWRSRGAPLAEARPSFPALSKRQ